MPAGQNGRSYRRKLTAEGGKTPRTWSELTGNLTVLGLNLNPSTGVISGTPPAPSGAPVSLTLKVTDPLLGEDQKVLDITIN
ncbi:MAG: putative Ig domain-containing protein [Candidatus Binatia bacterium]